MAFNPLGRTKGLVLNVLITIASSCGFLLFGYDNGVFAGILVSPWFIKTFHHPKASILGTVSAMYNVGGTVGGITAFFVGNTLGRRQTIMLGAGVTSIGTIVQCIAENIGTLTTGRIMTGIGVGIMTSTTGLWQAETTPAKRRGSYLCLQLLGGAIPGLALAQWVNYGFHNSTGRTAFVFPVAFQLVFTIPTIVLVPLLPESPRWLVKKDRRSEAREILARLQPECDVEHELAEIVHSWELERQNINSGHFKQLFGCGPVREFHRLCLACGVMIMHQLNGANSVTYYLPTILIRFIHLGHGSALWVTGLTSIVSIPGALITVLTIDRVGRIRFLVAGALLQGLTFATIAALLGAVNEKPLRDPSVHSYSIGVASLFFLYYVVNSMTWLGPSWAYPAEILPLHIREKGLALGNIFYWMFQFMMVEITPIGLATIEWRFYVILTCFNLAIATIIYFVYPETKGLSLEEVDLYFVKKFGTGVQQQEMEAKAEPVQTAEMKAEESQHFEVVHQDESPRGH